MILTALIVDTYQWGTELTTEVKTGKRQSSVSDQLNPLQLEFVMTNNTCCNDSCGQGVITCDLHSADN